MGTIFKTAFRSYETTRQIGQGGSGRVYEVAADDGKRYALKTLDPKSLTSSRRSRFHNEMSFCQKDVHPGIISVLDTGFSEVGGKTIPFYVMPLFPMTLRSEIGSGAAPLVLLKLFMEILDAVEAAHSRNVTHRDLKPENILVDRENGRLVVADFGIARFTGVDVASLVATGEGARLANFQYAAPEQRIKDGQVDHLADIYSLGLIGHELFTGQVPLGRDPKSVSDSHAEFSFLDPIFKQMLQQDPDNRPASIRDVKRLIGPYITLLNEDSRNAQQVQAATPLLGAIDGLMALGDKAAQIGARYTHSQLRKQLLNSYEGAQKAEASFLAIKDQLGNLVYSLARSLPFPLNAKQHGGDLLEVTSQDLGAVPVLRRPFVNSLDDARLEFEIWRGNAPIPGRYFLEQPKRIKMTKFLPDFDLDGKIVWKQGGRELSENDVAIECLDTILSIIDSDLNK